MAEAKEFLGEAQAEAKAFVNNFTKLEAEQAKELREKLVALDMIKLNDKHISKIIDLLPADKEDLAKISSDVHMDEKETNDILQTVKDYK